MRNVSWAAFIYSFYFKEKINTLRNNAMCDTMMLLPSLNWQQEGGVSMELLTSFILSVVAGVVAYYICKWFDSGEQNER